MINMHGEPSPQDTDFQLRQRIKSIIQKMDAAFGHSHKQTSHTMSLAQLHNNWKIFL